MIDHTNLQTPTLGDLFMYSSSAKVAYINVHLLLIVDDLCLQSVSLGDEHILTVQSFVGQNTYGWFWTRVEGM